MAYDDPTRAIGKRIRFEGGRITAVRLAGETLARHWLQQQWVEGSTHESLRRWLLAPLSAPPGSGSTPSCTTRTLCNCMNVSEGAIHAGIAQGMDLAQLKTQLGCGSMCGSCVPEIKRLLTAVAIN
jgi:assimilatory nitrate reductase catalytic subunit